MRWQAISGDEAAQDTVEYSLIIALVAVLAAAVFPFSTEAIASICEKTDQNLRKALSVL